MLQLLLIGSMLFVVTACGVKGPPLPPETRAVDVSTAPTKETKKK